jgi:riboflavin kinase/FMN adenylyltransferase
MQIFRGLEDLPQSVRGAALVLGSFDGVHRGHAALVAAARPPARLVGIVTFSPHPRFLTQAAQPPFLLTPGEEKYAALRALGADFCVELPFTREFASISAEDFVSTILAERLGPGHVICGYNFRFGAGRTGDVALLRRLGAQRGFSVESVASVLDAGGEAYSSTRIRDCLRAGDVAGAVAILGRPWIIKARLKQDSGAQGRSGYFHLGAYLKPLPGHYNVRAQFEDGSVIAAHLIISQDEHAGWLELPRHESSRAQDYVEIELTEFVAPLVVPQAYREAGFWNACYI